MTINVDGIQMCCPWPVITGSYLCRRCQLAGNDTVVDFFINSGRYWLAECQWIGMSEATAELNAAMKSIVDGRYISWVLFDRYCSWWCAEAWNIVRTLRTSSLMRFTLLGVGLHFVSTLFLYFQFFSLASSFIMISSSFFLPKKLNCIALGFFFYRWFIRNDLCQMTEASILRPIFPSLESRSFIISICWELFRCQCINGERVNYARDAIKLEGAHWSSLSYYWMNQMEWVSPLRMRLGWCCCRVWLRSSRMVLVNGIGINSNDFIEILVE